MAACEYFGKLEFSIVLELGLLQYLCEFGWFNNNYCGEFAEIMLNGSTLSCSVEFFFGKYHLLAYTFD